MGVAVAGETPSIARKSVGGAHKNLECTQAHPPEAAQSTCRKWGKWLKAGGELSKQHCSLSDLSPTYRDTMQGSELSHPDEYPRLHFLQCNMCWDYIYIVYMKEQIKTPQKELSDDEIVNLSDAEFRTLVIRNHHRNDWVQMQNRGRSEGYIKWNQEKYTGNQEWREGNQDSKQRFGTEGRYKISTRRKWKNNNSKNIKRGLEHSETTLKVSTSES